MELPMIGPPRDPCISSTSSSERRSSGSAKIGRPVDEAQAAALRRQFEALCVAGPEPFDLPAPALIPMQTTTDRLHGAAGRR